MSRHQIRIRVRDLRKERAMTQESLADLLGISRQTVIALESGRCLPSLPLALQIAEIFELPMENIFVWDQAVARELMRLHQNIREDRLLLAAEASVPVAVDVYRQEGNLIVEAVVPGFTKGDVVVEIEPARLSISGERTPTQLERAEYLAQEIELPTRFSRTIGLPAPIDPDRTVAEVRDGLLRIVAPLVRRSPHRVAIN